MAVLAEAEKLKPVHIARANALATHEVDLTGFTIGGDEGEFIFADAELQGTRCKVGVNRQENTLTWVRLELILDGAAAQHGTFEIEEALPDKVQNVRAGEW